MLCSEFSSNNPLQSFPLTIRISRKGYLIEYMYCRGADRAVDAKKGGKSTRTSSDERIEGQSNRMSRVFCGTIARGTTRPVPRERDLEMPLLEYFEQNPDVVFRSRLRQKTSWPTLPSSPSRIDDIYFRQFHVGFKAQFSKSSQLAIPSLAGLCC